MTPRAIAPRDDLAMPPPHTQVVRGAGYNEADFKPIDNACPEVSPSRCMSAVSILRTTCRRSVHEYIISARAVILR